MNIYQIDLISKVINNKCFWIVYWEDDNRYNIYGETHDCKNKDVIALYEAFTQINYIMKIKKKNIKFIIRTNNYDLIKHYNNEDVIGKLWDNIYYFKYKYFENIDIVYNQKIENINEILSKPFMKIKKHDVKSEIFMKNLNC